RQARAVRARSERAAGFVEADVTVGPEPENQQADAAGAANRPLVALALRAAVTHRAVQKMDPPRGQVHVIEQMPLHERAIAPRVAALEAEKLVEVERRRAAEIDAAPPIERRQLAIH